MKTASLRSLLCARPGALARGALLLLSLALLSTASGHAEEGPALPEGAITHVGMPPLLPYAPNDEASVRALCGRLVSFGRAHAGTRRGGDCLFAAAYAQFHFLDAPKTAAPLYAEALAAYPAADPTRAGVLLEQALYEMPRGNHPRAKALLKELNSWADARAPANMDVGNEARWHLVRAELAQFLPPLRAEMAESEGRFADAAKALENMLDDEEVRLGANQRARVWERIARWRQRAGDKPATERAIDAAIENATDERQRADLAFWRLHARHDLIAADGGPALTRTWPGPAFERDVHVFLRTVQGVEGTGTTYLALASAAFRAKRMEIALDIYLLALRAPDLVEAARGDANIWRGLLMGYAAAIGLERFEEAEQILSIVERIADEPIEEIDDYRVAIREARAAKRRREARAKDALPPEPTAPDAASEAAPGKPLLGRIETPSRPEGPELGSLEDEEPSSPDWLWLASAALLGLALALLLIRRSQA